MGMKTLIYCTDNQLDKRVSDLCIRYLKKVDYPIVSVSHEPMDLGTNICIGKQKRSWRTLYKQLRIGLEVAETKNVAIIEHDCLYVDEHFAWEPERDDTFYYNENVCFVQWATKSHPELNGMYSRFWKQRLALSQLVCNRESFLESTNVKLSIIGNSIKCVTHAGEPGVTKINNAQRWAASGRPVYLKKFLKEQLDKEKYDTFKTKIPNLDIRHDGNFTGPKRGIKRTYDIEYWGRFEDLIHENTAN
jgi:hypothetical protein